MNNSKIIFRNKGDEKLHVCCDECNGIKDKLLELRNRKTVRVAGNRIQMTLCYENSNLEFLSYSNEVEEIDDIPSFKNAKYKGKMLLLKNPGKRVKIVCTSKVSIAELVES